MQELGYTLTATAGTAAYLQKQGVKVDPVFKIHEGRPNIEDALRNGEVAMVLLTPSGDAYDIQDGKNLRRLALGLKVRNSVTKLCLGEQHLLLIRLNWNPKNSAFLPCLHKEHSQVLLRSLQGAMFVQVTFDGSASAFS